MGAERRLAAVMFTDMEGFTALMQSDEQLALAKRDKYTSVLQEKHEAFGGTIVQFFGDGSLSTFPNSVDAVACAIAVQQAFQGPLEVSVRIGIHVGNVMLEPTGLVGDAVNIASRIESFGLPGAVLVSDSVHDQVRNQVAFDFVDLGKFKLKNVGRPFSIYAIAVDGLVVPAPDFLHGKGEQLATLPANLPDPTSPLVGRESDLAALTDLIAEHRVVTITGPGGIGKTRTAIEVCRHLGAEFLDGISFVSLADVTDPTQFVPTLAEALDVKEAEGRTLGEGVTALIGDKKALLLLDNLEQIIEAAPTVADLVATCPELRLVVTSRTPLRIGAEREYQLAPLLLPPPNGKAVPEKLAAYPAVALFIQRAQRVNPTFALRTDNAKDVAEVCRRMDGLPLAIELAAARTKLLSPEALLERLDRTLSLLTGGARDAPERQRTLRATIEWSDDLLDPESKRLFARLSVFLGSFLLAAAEEVCDADLDALAALVDLSLLKPIAEDRFLMLETIREYAAEKLEASGEGEELRRRHASAFRSLAAGCYARRVDAEAESSDRLESDHDDLRAALEWLAAHDPDGELELAGSLGWFWLSHAHLPEGRRRLTDSLAQSRGEGSVRATALTA
ncbi:MAG: adenylate/guanylate cyclase domain-containing protein, partial [Actinomycetota bacterium]|nr:adenylate/guanylate cyclase domain-containing protein [Actinomycetota bacterium]